MLLSYRCTLMILHLLRMRRNSNRNVYNAGKMQPRQRDLYRCPWMTVNVSRGRGSPCLRPRPLMRLAPKRSDDSWVPSAVNGRSEEWSKFSPVPR